MFYNEYFTIDQNFKPCMSKSAINESPEYWMNFYPHESFIRFLQTVLESLSGSPKTVWLAAAYGTGKSFAVLVLQKLLMDAKERVEAWFNEFKKLIPDSVAATIWNLRQQRVLAVYDCGSDNITTPEQFLVRLQNTIISTLKEQKLTIPAFGHLDSLMERVREEGEYFFKTRDKIQDELVHLSPDITDVDLLEKRIAKPNLTNGLLGDVNRVLNERGIYLDLTIDNFLSWIEEIEKANNLSKILFIWDEFSTYVDQNRSQLTTFQEIANAAQQGKFYLLPVTHMKLESYQATGSASAKKINDRFTFCSLEMPTNTALKLTAHVFKVEPDQTENWDFEKNRLWHSVKNVVYDYMGPRDSDCQSSPEFFKDVLPIHPMTAFMIKFLATTAGFSNQRSMFDFLKGDPNHHEFFDFISRGGPYEAGRQYLTVDYLWDYFIERDDLGMSSDIAKIRMEFNRKSKLLNENEIRVFKTVLLYSLLDSLSNSSGHELIQPTISNIEYCFNGDGGISGIKDTYIRSLQEKHCLSVINDRCVTFREEANTEDFNRKFEEISENFKKYICDEPERLGEALENKIKFFKDKLHFVTRCSTPAKVAQTCQIHKDEFGPDNNKVLLQFIVAQDEKDHLEAALRAESIAKSFVDMRMLFIVFPDEHFCTHNQNAWKEYAQQLAHAEVTADSTTKTAYLSQAKQIFQEWVTKVLRPDTRLQIYKTIPSGEVNAIDCTWSTFEGVLRNYLKSNFECFLDDLSEYNTTAMSENTKAKGLQAWASAGLNRAMAQGQFKNLWKSLDNKGILADTAWFDSNPSSPLTKLRDICRKKLDNALSGTGQCSIRKLLIDLTRPPFGLLYLPFTAFIMGVAMHEWLNNPRRVLQWTDKVNSGQLDVLTLSEMIAKAIEDKGGNSIKGEKFVCRISQEEKAFIESAPIMFGIEREPNTNVDTVLNKISERLTLISNKVPLWTLKEYIRNREEAQTAEVMVTIINNLCKAMAYSSKSDPKNNKTAIVKEIGTLLQKNPGIDVQFGRYVDTDILSEAFQQYVDFVKPELKVLANNTGDGHGLYCQAIKDCCAVTASWLWSEENIADELDRIYAQYKIISSLQRFVEQKAYMPFQSAMDRLNKAIYQDNKISIDILAGDYPFMSEFKQLLGNISIANNILSFAQLLENNFDTIKELFFDPQQKIEIAILEKHFANQLGSLSNEEIQNIYRQLPQCAELSEGVFQQTVCQAIDTFLKDSMSTQLTNLWRNKTDSDNPSQWSLKHSLPVTVLFDTETEQVHEWLRIISQPSAYQVERLKIVYQQLNSLTFTNNREELMSRFLSRILPQKYQGLSIDSEIFVTYLRHAVSDNPNAWQQNPQILYTVIDRFVHESYQQDYYTQAVEKAQTFNDKQAKQWLLKLIELYPDVGLKILEGNK